MTDEDFKTLVQDRHSALSNMQSISMMNVHGKTPNELADIHIAHMVATAKFQNLDLEYYKEIVARAHATQEKACASPSIL